MMKKIIFICIFLFAAFYGYSQESIKNDIYSGLNNQDISKMQKHFHSTIDLTIPGFENSTSKNHAKQILLDFAKKNPFNSYKHNHHGTSKDGSVYVIGTLSTKTKNYRTYFLIKKLNNSFYIFQMQVEEE